MAIQSDSRYQHPGVLMLRYTVSILMLFHGVAKLGGIGPISAVEAFMRDGWPEDAQRP